jgi:hypothetical protein
MSGERISPPVGDLVNDGLTALAMLETLPSAEGANAAAQSAPSGRRLSPWPFESAEACVAEYYDGDGRRRWKTFKLEREAKDFEARVRGGISRIRYPAFQRRHKSCSAELSPGPRAIYTTSWLRRWCCIDPLSSRLITGILGRLAHYSSSGARRAQLAYEMAVARSAMCRVLAQTQRTDESSVHA